MRVRYQPALPARPDDEGLSVAIVNYHCGFLFRRLAVKVFLVGLCVAVGMVDDAVPMIRRCMESIKLQWDSADIDEVVIRPSRNNYCEPRSNTVEDRVAISLLHAKELVGPVYFRPVSSLGFSAMTTSWQCFAVWSTWRNDRARATEGRFPDDAASLSITFGFQK